jgi:hypothetical protein
MSVGFILDNADSGARKVSSWVEGAPIKGWLGVKLGGRKPIDIQTWRCSRCGFLESYAPR